MADYMMDDSKAVTLTRMPSDGSTCSTASRGSSLCLPIKGAAQRPSIAAPGVPRPGETHVGDPEEDSPACGGLAVGRWSGRHADREAGLPVRELAKTLQEKRAERDVRSLTPRSPGVWESWAPTQIIHTQRLRPGPGWEALSRLVLWRHALHTIESRFGVGVKAYFVFLRYLVYLNLFHGGIILVFILGPAALYGRDSIKDSLSFRQEDSPFDFLLGTGFLKRSPVFYGFYTPGSLSSPCLNTPMLYFTGVFTVLALSLIMLVRRMAVGYKRSWLLGKRHDVNLSFKAFCGWDFTIQDPDAAALKHGFIRNDLKLHLDEQNFHLREAQRTLLQRVGLYSLRVSLNLLVLFLLGGAFALIYFAIQWSNNMAGDSTSKVWLNFLVNYLPAISMSLVNLTLPRIFRVIASFEDYSLSTQLNTTLMRSIVLKLASLGFFMLFIFHPSDEVGDKCWMNQFGREMYKFVMFDFIASICCTLLLVLPAKLLKERRASCWLARLSGRQRFLISFNVLDLVYNQTLLWAGVLYCPLLPFLGIVKLVAVFYFKKFKVLQCCVPEQRMFRASSSTLLFYLLLLLGLFMAAGTASLRFNIPSPCGPSEAGAGVLNATRVCVDSLPGPARKTLTYLASGAFVVPFITAEIFILTFYVILGRSNRTVIDSLKHLLVMYSSDNRFLVLVLAEHGSYDESESFDRYDLPADQPAHPTEASPDPHLSAQQTPPHRPRAMSP